ncbi:Uncharacterized protein FKW44_016445, partial [Caligus rogercresseyi]
SLMAASSNLLLDPPCGATAFTHDQTTMTTSSIVEDIHDSGRGKMEKCGICGDMGLKT